jgi:hypothetical protein
MTTQLPPLAASYVQATNSHDPAAFRALFAADALVNDNGREFRGAQAIQEWSDREIFAADVTLEVIDAVEREGETVLTTIVEGTFDRTGLPDPVIIDQHLVESGGRIVALTCRLAGDAVRA